MFQTTPFSRMKIYKLDTKCYKELFTCTHPNQTVAAPVYQAALPCFGAACLSPAGHVMTWWFKAPLVNLLNSFCKQSHFQGKIGFYSIALFYVMTPTKNKTSDE